MNPLPEPTRLLLCDPQTSGGLLVAVQPSGVEEFLAACESDGGAPRRIGEVLPAGQGPVVLVE